MLETILISGLVSLLIGFFTALGVVWANYWILLQRLQGAERYGRSSKAAEARWESAARLQRDREAWLRHAGGGEIPEELLKQALEIPTGE